MLLRPNAALIYTLYVYLRPHISFCTHFVHKMSAHYTVDFECDWESEWTECEPKSIHLENMHTINTHSHSYNFTCHHAIVSRHFNIANNLFTFVVLWFQMRMLNLILYVRSCCSATIFQWVKCLAPFEFTFAPHSILRFLYFAILKIYDSSIAFVSVLMFHWRNTSHRLFARV